jgi:hypothetical protein
MKKGIHYIVVLIGLLILWIGLWLVKVVIEPEGIMKALPYVLVGIGCGVFGKGMGEIVSIKSMKNHPEIKKQMEIDKQDERNIAIGNRAKAKAYDMMVFIFGALMLAFALMGIDMIVIILLVCAYLFVIAYGFYYRSKYDKEM